MDASKQKKVTQSKRHMHVLLSSFLIGHIFSFNSNFDPVYHLINYPILQKHSLKKTKSSHYLVFCLFALNKWTFLLLFYIYLFYR